MSSIASPRHDVLVVDDNDDVREAFVTMLRVSGCGVASAWSVEDALRQIRQGLQPCVVLLDLRMPRQEGWSLIDRLGSQPVECHTSVVIVSGDADQRAKAEARGHAFFLKPVEGSALVAAVDRYCQRHQR